MNNIKIILVNSFKSTKNTVLLLAKAVIPVVFLITLIEFLNILPVIARIFEPFMNIFNLPGEASLPLILGNLVNLYSGITAIESLNLTSSQITTIAIMLLICHSIIMETTVIATIGITKKYQLFIRVGLLIVVGIIVGAFYG